MAQITAQTTQIIEHLNSCCHSATRRSVPPYQSAQSTSHRVELAIPGCDDLEVPVGVTALDTILILNYKL